MPLSRPNVCKQRQCAHTDVHVRTHRAEECEENQGHTIHTHNLCAQKQCILAASVNIEKEERNMADSDGCSVCSHHSGVGTCYVTHAHGSHYIPLLLFQRVHLCSV